MPLPARCIACNAATIGSNRACRGNCQRCYKAHRLMVVAGETTWAELERAGVVLAPQPKNLVLPPLRRL